LLRTRRSPFWLVAGPLPACLRHTPPGARAHVACDSAHLLV